MSGQSAAQRKKICCKCGRDITDAQRMKDHEGQYWCVPCGEADRRQQLHANSGICDGCGESFSRAQLMEISGQRLCLACRKRKFAHGHNQARPGILSSIKSLFGK